MKTVRLVLAAALAVLGVTAAQADVGALPGSGTPTVEVIRIRTADGQPVPVGLFPTVSREVRLTGVDGAVRLVSRALGTTATAEKLRLEPGTPGAAFDGGRIHALSVTPEEDRYRVSVSWSHAGEAPRPTEILLPAGAYAAFSPPFAVDARKGGMLLFGVTVSN